MLGAAVFGHWPDGWAFTGMAVIVAFGDARRPAAANVAAGYGKAVQGSLWPLDCMMRTCSRRNSGRASRPQEWAIMSISLVHVAAIGGDPSPCPRPPGRAAAWGYGWVTPVGQVFWWQRNAWMHPRENMKPRAVLMKSAPQASAQAPWGVTSLPEAMMRLPQAGFDETVHHPRQGFQDGQGHVVGQGRGAAPEPPRRRPPPGSPGRRVAIAAFTASTSSCMNCQPPMAVLIPTGLPVISHPFDHVRAVDPYCRFRDGDWREGIATHGNAADAGDLLGHLGAAGNTPPLPGLAPGKALISKAPTASWAAISGVAPDRGGPRRRVPVFRGTDLEDDVATAFEVDRATAPSPVSTQQPARAAPRDRTALHRRFGNGPKLMPLTLTMERPTKGLGRCVAVADGQRRSRQARSVSGRRRAH